MQQGEQATQGIACVLCLVARVWHLRCEQCERKVARFGAVDYHFAFAARVLQVEELLIAIILYVHLHDKQNVHLLNCLVSAVWPFARY